MESEAATQSKLYQNEVFKAFTMKITELASDMSWCIGVYNEPEATRQKELGRMFLNHFVELFL